MITGLGRGLLPFACLLMAIRVEAAPDAWLVNISIQGSGYRAGDQVPLTIELRNSGDAPLSSVPVLLTADGLPFAEWKPAGGELAPGETVKWQLTYTGDRGMHLLVASVDPFDEVPETDKSNNSAFVNLGLEEPRPPFPWLTIPFGVGAFIIGLYLGGLLRGGGWQPAPRSRGHS